jgi:hypothetical protein
MPTRVILASVDRDSVSAGDDCQSHESSFNTTPGTEVAEFLRDARRASPLAGIAGGQATWLIDTQGFGNGCIGVIAQQWAEPKLLIPGNTTVEQLYAGRHPTVFFRYWCQASPEAVFEALKSGNALPPRYGQ